MLHDCCEHLCYCLHSAVVPASGQVNSLMVVSFVIHNKSEIVQDFEIKMIQDDDTHFLAAGNQMVCFLNIQVWREGNNKLVFAQAQYAAALYLPHLPPPTYLQPHSSSITFVCFHQGHTPSTTTSSPCKLGESHCPFSTSLTAGSLRPTTPCLDTRYRHMWKSW